MKKIRKILIILCSIFGIIFVAIIGYYILRPQTIPILAYHDLKPYDMMTKEDKNDYFIDSVENFEKQMKYISKHNYKTLSMDEFYCWMIKKCGQPKKSVVITFDDGNKSVYEYVLPILKKYNLKATSFVIASRIIKESDVSGDYNFLTKEMIEDSIDKYSGLEFQSHTYNMHRSINNVNAVNVYNSDQMRDDTTEVGNYLNSSFIAYPFGDYNQTYIKVLKEQKYKMGFLYSSPFIRASRNNDLFKIPRITIGNNLSTWRFKLALIIGMPSTHYFPR